jgi:hypothetical protein
VFHGRCFKYSTYRTGTIRAVTYRGTAASVFWTGLGVLAWTRPS